MTYRKSSEAGAALTDQPSPHQAWAKATCSDTRSAAVTYPKALHSICYDRIREAPCKLWFEVHLCSGIVDQSRRSTLHLCEVVKRCQRCKVSTVMYHATLQGSSSLIGRQQHVLCTQRCPNLRPRLAVLAASRVQHRQLSRATEAKYRCHSREARVCRAAQSEASIDQDSDLVGEDAAYFDVKQQTTKKWTVFTALLVGVLGLIYVVCHPKSFSVCTV